MARSYIDKGTLITLGDGSKAAVENIKVGDKVQSYNMNADEFDMSHLDNNEQISVEVVEVNSETIPGEEVSKLSLSDKSVLSVRGCDLFSAVADVGILALPSDDDIPKELQSGRTEITVGDSVYVDSGELLEEVSVEGIDDWTNSREMHNICIMGGDTVFANGVLVSIDKELTVEEEEKQLQLQLAGEEAEEEEAEEEAAE